MDSDVNQSDIARRLGVNRSVISREIRGQKDMSLGRVAELATVMGYAPVFDLEKIETMPKANWFHIEPGVQSSATAKGVEIEAPSKFPFKKLEPAE
jgi:transcriptional regulator with XRE-family HTH domain